MAAMAVDGSPSASASPPPPTSKLQNTSFTSYRLTPLYNFKFSRLKSYERDFRDIVRGDSIRGVQVTSVGPIERAKPVPLRFCEWTVDDDLLPGQPFESLVISIEWEDSSTFTAVLVPNFTSSDTVLGKRKRGTANEGPGDFEFFPLLLVRGAQVVVQHLMDYLTTHFDSRSSIMSIPSEILSQCLQDYLSIIFQEEGIQRTLGRKLKILEIIFSIPEVKETKVKSALRKLTLSIGASDVKDLYERSDTIFDSLDKHMRTSTAIHLADLKVSRVACAGMVIDISGKLKIFESAGIEGTNMIVEKMVRLAMKSASPL